MSTLLSGTLVSQKILSKLKAEIEKLSLQPKLVAILVGHHPASEVYVKLKMRACNEVGIAGSICRLQENVTQEELFQKILQLSTDPSIDGIILQQPLPKQIHLQGLWKAFDPKKDVDGFHPHNIAALVLQEEGFLPATPLGILLLLNHYKIDPSQKRTLIIGRSAIVGRPLSILLSQNRKTGNATVTLAHSKTPCLEKLISEHDLIISAVGNPLFIKKEMVKKGSILIDVGISKVDSKIVGDVDFENVKSQTSMISPVPGGVGPMTIAALLFNTFQSHLKKNIDPIEWVNEA